MTTEIDEIVIKGVTYVPKGSENPNAPKLNDMPYVLIRCDRSGVFFGYRESESADGKKVTLRNVRGCYIWYGAATLLQLATDGTTKPNDCKFTITVDKAEFTDVIETLFITEKAAKSIGRVAEWKL